MNNTRNNFPEGLLLWYDMYCVNPGFSGGEFMSRRFRKYRTD